MTTRWINALLSLPLLVVSAQALADEPQAEAQRLVASHRIERYRATFPNSSIRAGCAMGAINAPTSVVRKLITDYGHYSEFITKFEKSRIVARTPAGTDVYLQVPILHGAAKVWAVVRFGAPQPEESGERIDGQLFGQGNVEDLRAVWHLLPAGENRSVLKLELLMVPRLPVPSSLVTSELEDAAETALSMVRDRAEASFAAAGAPQAAAK